MKTMSVRQHDMKKPIAIVEDEPDIVELMTIHLEKAGFPVRSFSNGSEFLRFIKKTTPALVVLDLMLPDIDGLEICKIMRKREDLAAVPVIMVTAKGEEMDKVLGLELGADDYMTKPFSPKELAARVRAVLRRQGPSEQASKLVEIGGTLTIDLTKYEVTLGGSRIELTSTEFKILELLSSKKGWVFSRDKILNHLWGDEKAVIDRTVDVHIRHLREKLGDAAQFIKNIRGVGYKLEE
ncbi:MAG: response regulator transcription factor [Proteobacteria bacterium]|nr:response regulator transcription factor [Pseudomonadota bacterium]